MTHNPNRIQDSRTAQKIRSQWEQADREYCQLESIVDLVWAISIFTHLDADQPFAWLVELHRILRPGGMLLATV